MVNKTFPSVSRRSYDESFRYGQPGGNNRMLKKIIFYVVLTLVFTLVLWSFTGNVLRLSAPLDDAVFIGSPLLALALAILVTNRFVSRV